MEQQNIPFVMLHSSMLMNASMVALDDAKGSYLVTNHLFELGHISVGAIFKSDDMQGLTGRDFVVLVKAPSGLSSSYPGTIC